MILDDNARKANVPGPPFRISPVRSGETVECPRPVRSSSPPLLIAGCRIGGCCALFVLVFFWCSSVIGFSAQPLPEFGLQQVTVAVVRADGRPAPGVAIYGWCSELNLVWPRRDKELQGRNDVLWHESYLGRTDGDGRVQVAVPAGKWGFFAAGQCSGAVLAAWSDFRERTSGETVRLAPGVRKEWTLAAAGEAVVPKRVFVRADLFPVWVPVNAQGSSGVLPVEMTAGRMHLWAEADGSLQRHGFALGFGPVDDKTAGGELVAPGPIAKASTRGGGGWGVLSWSRLGEFGLEGAVRASAPAQFWFTPGAFTLAYRRPVGSGLTGDFVGHLYHLDSGSELTLSFEGPLAVGLDQEFEKPDKKGHSKLAARLYLVDTNGHLLGNLETSAGRPTGLAASVSLAGRRFNAVRGGSGSDVPGQGESGPTFFVADVGGINSGEGATWQFAGAAGLLPSSQMQESEMETVTSQSYTVKVPRALVPHARNVLEQAETLVQNMEAVSGRKRRQARTVLYVKPGRSGAYATHGGGALGIGSKLFYSDNIMARHDMVHETGHNLDFFHGGLHETIVETTRSFGGEQVTQQPAKWMFIDRMNGVSRKEILYPNTGLYLYCYAQGGKPFVHFMVKNDKAVSDKLKSAGFTVDEATAALCSLALSRDLTPVCAAYGLSVSAPRLSAASATARGWVKP